MRLSILLIITCLSIPAIAQETTPEPAPPQPTISNYDLPRETLLPELEIQGVIPSGAEQQFVQGNSTFSGADAQFSTFAIENQSPNILMGATLSFTPAGEALEFCGMALRAQRQEDQQQDDSTGRTRTTVRLEAYLAIGLDHNDQIFVFQRGTDEANLVLADAPLLPDAPLVLWATVLNDQLTVYANGQPVITGYEVTLEAGGFGFLYAGTDAESTCTSQSLFGYRFADEQVAGCRATTNRIINQRGGAGTEFAIVTQLQAGASRPVIGQTIGSDGFTWWLLDDNSWVRDDVVTTLGFCRILPQIDPNNR